MKASMIPQAPGTYYVCFREDFVLLSEGSTKRKEKSRSSPHCKALILSILDHWTYDNLSKQRSASIHITIPQWENLMYGMFKRNAIMDSLEELCMEGWIKREPFKPISGGRDQYRYTLQCEMITKAIGTLKNQRCTEEINLEGGKINDQDKSTLKNQPSYSPQHGNFNDQGGKINVAQVNFQPSHAQSTLKNQPLIDDRDSNREINRMNERDDPPMPSSPDDSSFNLSSSNFISQETGKIPTDSPDVPTGDVISPPASNEESLSNGESDSSETGVVSCNPGVDCATPPGLRDLTCTTLTNLETVEPSNNLASDQLLQWIKELRIPKAKSPEKLKLALAFLGPRIDSLDQLERYYTHAKGQFKGIVWLSNLASENMYNIWLQGEPDVVLPPEQRPYLLEQDCNQLVEDMFTWYPHLVLSTWQQDQYWQIGVRFSDYLDDVFVIGSASDWYQFPNECLDAIVQYGYDVLQKKMQDAKMRTGNIPKGNETVCV